MAASDSTYYTPPSHRDERLALTHTRSRTSTSETEKVNITIGDDDHNQFLIDYALLIDRSPLLELALEEYGDEVRLLDEDPAVFHNYLKCLKYRPERVKVKITKSDAAAGDGRGKDEVDVFAGLAEVWILAEKLQDLHTANDVVDEIQRRHTLTGRFPGAASVDFVFAETTTYSPLRRLLVDLFVLEASPQDYEGLKAQGVSGDFWFAVASEMRGLVEEIAWGPGRFEDAFGKRVAERPRCDWHLFTAEGCASCGRGRG